jgi:hypothetical protein
VTTAVGIVDQPSRQFVDEHLRERCGLPLEYLPTLAAAEALAAAATTESS